MKSRLSKLKIFPIIGVCAVLLAGCREDSIAFPQSVRVEDLTIRFPQYAGEDITGYDQMAEDLLAETGIRLNIEIYNDNEVEELYMPDLVITQDVLPFIESDEDYSTLEFISEDTEKYLPRDMDLTKGLPAVLSVRTFYYNPEILESAGITKVDNLNEALEAARAVKKNRPDVTPLALDLSDTNGFMNMGVFFYGQGGGFFDENGDYTLANDSNIYAADILKSMYKEKLTNDDPFHAGSRELIDGFKSGEYAMIICPGVLLKDSDAEASAITGLYLYDRFFVNPDIREKKKGALSKFFSYYYDRGCDIIADYYGLEAPRAYVNAKSCPYDMPSAYNNERIAMQKIRDILNGQEARKVLEEE